MLRDVRGYKMMSIGHIYLSMITETIALAVFSAFAPYAAPLLIVFAMFAGWQMGTLTERLDWNNWYREKK